MHWKNTSEYTKLKEEKKTDNVTRATIVHEDITNGTKQYDIAKMFNVNPYTVSRVLKHYKETRSYERVKNLGKPKKLNTRDKREILYEISKDLMQLMSYIRKTIANPI
ncbi:Homeodomain-like DNA binding domain-containing transcription factor [Phycomyces blakesleeanus NRRL 1555(-)]|uniref:Homeodomain-like DNA binding domain-containing transcription factor n=1 Tax=Phycomyces blakesleeanus (strain ATCC 8743b / DSM 1359 / FGSC 10004 / NBRC 33097 / NRRL 1555) TaxID=763407 RepID=A0A167M5Z2_PHYB8|nr:Homeodomain-like DNA binding domain-containing transcription factor [Phycomyces blakesleeanus NRRL 1555(-)]OAD71904.1 Homeodomain-like DNA binding domain-containing transcription factor [Phycomyces blakesleeanus NRRL 1555(-)]|eukprot:XP_018289944.1 Homeodomain-like DNA binding domain-containing transcription factor [Phycomyces blakesleeanus NRRL 1555(-)]